MYHVDKNGPAHRLPPACRCLSPMVPAVNTNRVGRSHAYNMPLGRERPVVKEMLYCQRPDEADRRNRRLPFPKTMTNGLLNGIYAWRAMTAKVYRTAVIETYLIPWLSAVPHYANNRKASCKGMVRSLRQAIKQPNKHNKTVYFMKLPLLFLYHSHEWSGRPHLGKPPATSRFLPCFQFINLTETKRFTETFCKFAHQL